MINDRWKLALVRFGVSFYVNLSAGWFGAAVVYFNANNTVGLINSVVMCILSADLSMYLDHLEL